MYFLNKKLGELSTIQKFQNADNNTRKKGINYEVETISLLELLDNHNAPKVIDYLSVDTEGSEYEILNTFDFDKYKFRIITVEHNFDVLKRNKIKNLLEINGYQRVFENLSKFDDWYINK